MENRRDAGNMENKCVSYVVTDVFGDKVCEIKENLEIVKVIHNMPATIVFWSDGTKTVVKCHADDKYDKDKGVLLCIAKKFYGNTKRFHKELNKWCWLINDKTIFDNADFVDTIKNVLRKYSTDELVNLYNHLNIWNVPDEIFKMFNYPVYIQEHFNSFPLIVKDRTVSPLINLVKQQIIRRVTGSNVSKSNTLNSKHTWEEYHNEHQNLG